MSDLKSPWDNQPAPIPGTGGETIVSRGSDPLIDLGGTSGLQPLWDAQPVPTLGGQETGNPVSGMPTTPSRWEPSGTPPPPPDLTAHNAGTIDEK